MHQAAGQVILLNAKSRTVAISNHHQMELSVSQAGPLMKVAHPYHATTDTLMLALARELVEALVHGMVLLQPVLSRIVAHWQILQRARTHVQEQLMATHAEPPVTQLGMNLRDQKQERVDQQASGMGPLLRAERKIVESQHCQSMERSSVKVLHLVRSAPSGAVKDTK